MKKLIVSVKSPREVLSGFKRALKAARQGRLKGDHYGLSFDNKKDFNRFAKNLDILSVILNHKPKSIYQLAKLVKMDVSNLNKLILFFEESGVIKIKTSTSGGRTVKTPVVEYEQIEFDLKNAG